MSASAGHPARAVLVLAVGVVALFTDLWLLSGPHLAGVTRAAALAGLTLLTGVCLVGSFRRMTGGPTRDDERLPERASP